MCNWITVIEHPRIYNQQISTRCYLVVYHRWVLLIWFNMEYVQCTPWICLNMGIFNSPMAWVRQMVGFVWAGLPLMMFFYASCVRNIGKHIYICVCVKYGFLMYCKFSVRIRYGPIWTKKMWWLQWLHILLRAEGFYHVFKSRGWINSWGWILTYSGRNRCGDLDSTLVFGDVYWLWPMWCSHGFWWKIANVHPMPHERWCVYVLWHVSSCLLTFS
jgi:hypothetical protein